MFFWKTAKETVPERPIRISSVEWRDGQQSLLATRIRTQDAIALTGGIVYSKRMADWITDRVSFIAPVYRYPGEGEIQALYEGAMRVVRGEEEAKIYE